MRLAAIIALLLPAPWLGCVVTRPPEAARPAPESTQVMESEVPAEGPRVEVQRIDRGSEVAARREFGAVANQLRGCPNESPLPVRVRVVREGDHTRITFLGPVPDTLGPEARRCVLDAMSTVHLDDVRAQGSPSDRPSGFTADLVISW